MLKRVGWAALSLLTVSGWVRGQDAGLFERLDKNRDGFLTKDEIDEEKQSLFERLLRTSDENKDGKLSKEEFPRGAGKRPERPADAPAGAERFGDVKAVFAKMDRNGDGKLSSDELPERMRDKFKELDANNDGVLDETELRRAMSVMAGKGDGKRAGEMFDRLDANGDGKITLNEIPADRQESFRRILERAGGDGLNREQFARAVETITSGGDASPERRPVGLVPGGPLFQAIDLNNDGELSADEMARAAESLKKLDKNGDGKLTRDEVFGAMPAAAGTIDSGKELFRLFDKDGDGKLSRDEVPERMREQFDRIDANGDGKIDPEELRRAFQARFGGASPEAIKEQIKKRQEGKK